MNINQNINKLLYVLKIRGQFYKINSFRFYNENKGKYNTKYQILKKELEPVIDANTLKIIYRDKYNLKRECYSKIDLMKYLAEESKKIGSEADGK